MSLFNTNNGFGASNQYAATGTYQQNVERLRDMQEAARADVNGFKTVAQFSAGEKTAIAQKLGLSLDYINQNAVEIDGHVFLLVDDAVLLRAKNNGNAYWDQFDQTLTGGVVADDANSLEEYLFSPTSNYWRTGGQRPSDFSFRLTQDQLFQVRGYQPDNFMGGATDANGEAMLQGNAFHVKRFRQADGTVVENALFDNSSVFLDAQADGRIAIESSDAEFAQPITTDNCYCPPGETPPGAPPPPAPPANDWDRAMQFLLDFMRLFLDWFGNR